MDDAPAATSPKPNTAATMAITKNTAAQYNIKAPIKGVTTIRYANR